MNNLVKLDVIDSKDLLDSLEDVKISAAYTSDNQCYGILLKDDFFEMTKQDIFILKLSLDLLLMKMQEDEKNN